MTTYFTSDLHFGHRLVAGLRGFSDHPTFVRRSEALVDIAAHDQAVCDGWRSVVRKADDIVYVLGDLAITNSAARLAVILDQIDELPGRKRLLLGNHDPGHPMHRESHRWLYTYHRVFESVETLAQVKINGHRVMLSHFPYGNDIRHSEEYGGVDRYAPWRPADTGLWLLHGHTHSNRVQSSLTGDHSIHVGVDAWAMKPVSAAQIAQLLPNPIET